MRLPVLESRGTNEYCSAQKSRKLPGLLDWVENGTNNSWLPNHLYKHHISQYHNPIGCTECCRGSNDSNMYDFCMTSLDMSARCLAFEKSRKAEPPRSSSKPQDMRKQRQRIHEQQIMHYFVQILQANFDLAKSPFQLAVYIMCISISVDILYCTFEYI